jgi:hypothetical protein
MADRSARLTPERSTVDAAAVIAVTAERPVKLTFPSYDIGAADILASGRSVGFCLAEFWCWRAWLYATAQDRRTPRPSGCEEVTARTLGDLRWDLRERVELKGQWWT